MTEVRGHNWREADYPRDAKVGDQVHPDTIEFDRLSDGEWRIPGMDNIDPDPCTGQVVAVHQNGDSVVVDYAWPGSDSGSSKSTGGTSTHTWKFDRNGSSLTVTEDDRFTYKNGGGGTHEFHYKARRLEASDPTPAPTPTAVHVEEHWALYSQEPPILTEKHGGYRWEGVDDPQVGQQVPGWHPGPVGEVVHTLDGKWKSPFSDKLISCSTNVVSLESEEQWSDILLVQHLRVSPAECDGGTATQSCRFGRNGEEVDVLCVYYQDHGNGGEGSTQSGSPLRRSPVPSGRRDAHLTLSRWALDKSWMNGWHTSDGTLMTSREREAL